MILTINMLLKKLIKNLPKLKKNIKIKGITTDSKKVKKNFIFFAIKGNNRNGEKFIDQAIQKGAIAVVCSKNCKYKYKNTPIIKKSDVRYFLSKTVSEFYNSKPKNIIAVTGTNGKTSVADLFYQILNLSNIPVASIGTLGIKYNNRVFKSNLTSPDPIFLHKTLQKIKDNKIDNVIIEASSHGLDQKRIDSLNLNAGIFTNFSQDHLDYHKTMSSYLNAKLRLFKEILPHKKSIITDTSIKEFSKLKQISKKNKLKIIDINPIKRKLKNKFKLEMNNFQLNNLSMAIAAAKLSKLSEKRIFSTIKRIKAVSGRLEYIKSFPNNIKVFVDFAHTPDALLQSLKALKKNKDHKISLVFGCGGDRDFKKRPLMARIASSYCEKIYITDDNPRNENPKKIREQLIKNIKNKNCFNIENRFEAIKAAILNADPNEIILVAGKGHETQQIYKNKIITFSDKKNIKKIKLKRSSKKKNKDYLLNKKIFTDIVKAKVTKNFHGLAIDSREVRKKNLFLTIKGKNNDGADYISQALKKGASFIISSKVIKNFKNKTVKVKNVINFLNDFALKKRINSLAKIIAITGSAGKTSLKNLLKDLLQNFGETLSSPKSYNNHFGVPLSLSNLKIKHKYGVFEVGMSKAGEINALSKMIKPDIGLITNIGEAHIENFRNLRGIADAKSELINNIKENGTIILNRDDKYFNFLERKAKLKKIKTISFGMSKKSNIYPTKIIRKSRNIKMLVKVDNQFLNLETKDLNIYNILSSIAVLKKLNLNLSEISKIFKNFQPTEGRGKIHNILRYKKKFKLIDESYNSNPLSLKNAINNFNTIKKQNFKKYLLLGDMLELGKKSDDLHKNLSKVINNSDIDKVFIKGTKTLTTYKNINIKKRGNIFQQEEDIDLTFNDIISNNDYLMIKGSNATGLSNFSKRMIKGL